MIEKRLKEMDFKITDLAEFLKISRPTIYKYIKSFDSKDYDSINFHVLSLFKYIEKFPLAGKKAVLNFILSNFDEVESDGSVFTKIKSLLISNPENIKARFIELLMSSGDFDDVCEYLLKIQPILRKRRPTKKEIELLKPYDEIRNIVENRQ